MNESRALNFRWIGYVGLLPSLLLGACASPGPPRPPSLNLAETVSTPTAERVGNEVRLHWITPEKTTEGLAVHGPMSAIVCRAALTPKQACAEVRRLTVVAGPSEVVDKLPPELVTGEAGVLVYRVEVLNARGRSAGPSSDALVASGPAPPSIKEMQAKPSEQGAVLTWRAQDARDTVELHRQTTSTAKPVSQSAFGVKPAASDVVLRVPPGAGGLDRTAEMGQRYVYTAQNVRTLSIEGHSLLLRSAVSAPVALEMRDVFPPLRPSGLEAIAAGLVVDLSWEPNTEADLQGYLVLRGENGPPVELTPTPVLEPSFQDRSVLPNRTYRYTVVAVDKAGNRSPQSDTAHVSVRTDVP